MKLINSTAYAVYSPCDKGTVMSIGGYHYNVRGPWNLVIRADLIQSVAKMPNERHDDATYVIVSGGEPDYLVVEPVEHFIWRLRFVLDTDQNARHPFIYERPDNGVGRCLICNETSMESFRHEKSQIITFPNF
jgi:hypothetical protein